MMKWFAAARVIYDYTYGLAGNGINNLLLRKKPSGGTCWRTKRVYALQQKAIGQVLGTRDYNYSGTSCTTADYLDTWYKYNDVGNVIATLDYDGNITSRIDMESFGTVHQGGYNTPRLTTKEYDTDSELYYFNQRWYDMHLGMFISKAKPRFDFEHPYLFVESSTTNLIDVSGEIGLPGCIAGGALGVGESLLLGSIDPHISDCRAAMDAVCKGAAGCASGALMGGAISKFIKAGKAFRAKEWLGGFGHTAGGVAAGGAGFVCKSPCDYIVDSVCGTLETGKRDLERKEEGYRDHGL